MSFLGNQFPRGKDSKKATVAPLNRSSVYGTYLCREIPIEYPTEDGNDDIQSCIKALRRSNEYFSKRKQKRNCERLQFEMALEFMRGNYWEDARRLLLPLWQHLSWRQAGWWQLLCAVDEALGECARYCRDGSTFVATQWELLNSAIRDTLDLLPDLSNCLEPVADARSKLQIVLQAECHLSPLSTTLAFGSAEGHVGEPFACQLVISSRAHRMSKPIIVSQIRLALGGGFREVHIGHAATVEPTFSSLDGSRFFYEVNAQNNYSSIREPDLANSTSSLGARAFSGECELTIAPSTTKVLSFTVMPREAGEIKLSSVTVCVMERLFDLLFVASHIASVTPQDWWVRSDAGLSKKIHGRDLVPVASILPKLSKMRIAFVDVLKTYFADENVSVTIRLDNGEEEDANITLAVRILGPVNTTPSLTWGSGFARMETKGAVSREPTNHLFSELPCKLIATGTLSQTVKFQAKSETAQYVLEVKALYSLCTEPDTPLSKTFATDIKVIRPFNTICAFSPRAHGESWPSYFEVTEAVNTEKLDCKGGKRPTGILQAWLLTAITSARVSDSLEIEDVTVHAINVQGNDTCMTTLEGPSITRPVLLSHPDDVHKVEFGLTIHGRDLDDLELTAVELELKIKWRRQGPDTTSASTMFAVPKISISLSEPRVLVAAFNEPGSPGLVHVDYTIENPSMHLLNFDLTMESSEEFVFSGTKATQLQLVPLSRRTVRYSLLSLNKGTWISPHLSVKDIHFGKILEQYPTYGMRLDKKGISAWVDSND